MRLSDLPADVRRQIKAGKAAIPSPATNRRARAARPAEVSYRCGSCPEVSTSYAAAERHADSHGGARIEYLPPTR